MDKGSENEDEENSEEGQDVEEDEVDDEEEERTQFHNRYKERVVVCLRGTGQELH
ncbi:hypothetical protein SCLCIDRAFT_24880 [Scleroderma citrinum Foug A]|uniref:Uncharacterized protein n=1 Tax=Scleroderma citrinum Foug A TaxID=1036808 RepID=A0A0C3E3G4_9AGAM|nr:hypothetical protein SCLCIDRAFT_24880 [Scleroderma citrinum Foug A]